MTDKKGGEDHRRVDVVGTTTTTTDTSRKQQQHQKHDGEKQRNTKVISGKYSRECDSKRIRGIQVYKAKLSVGSDNPRKGKTVGSSSSSSKQSSSWFLKLLPSFRATSSIRLYTIIFFVLYLYQGTMVLRSIGQPYREFLLKADAEGFQIVQGSVQLRAEFNHQYRDLNDVNRRITKLGWTDWIDMDIEQLAIEKKRDKEQSVLDSIPKHLRVPGKYQTAFWPTLLFGIFVTFHAFLLLLQQWSVSFNILMNYIEMDCDIAVDIMNNVLPNIDLNNYLASHTGSSSNNKSNNGSTATTTTGTDTSSSSTTTTPTTEAGKSGSSPTKYTKDAFGNYIVFPDREITTIPSSLPTHARIISSKDDEKDVLVPIQYLPSLGMCIEYHRRKYYYNVTERMWCKIRCQTTFPVTILNQWEGFQTNEALITAQIRFGPNLFQVKQPTFTELYQKQLLNPFSVFQIFCVLLWAIDDYITYSLFSLFMVLMFEGTVVFQRLKSLQALQSMGNPSRLIYVYRNKQWIPIDSAELLPGDIISLVRIKPHRAATSTKKNDTDDKKKDGSSTKPNTVVTAARIEDEGGDIVPADLVLLRGSTVVNEASLTGESVPQMKEGITELYDPTSTSTSTSAGDNKPQPHTLSMKLRHKMNVVYAGTKMLQCSGGGGNNNAGRDDAAAGSTVAPALFQQIPEPPDHGCTCFVLRTGFASAQGKLVRMIEGSQEKVKGHEKETGLLLGLLCIFAILSSSYVLYHGMQNKNRSKYELLLHCILIVTSVIRPELPMQMALAVNNSLMTLMKLHVFCTEPYRVPVAGKLTSCLFDKTGTLTTDELVATGICSPSKLFTKVDDDKVDDTKLFTPLHEIYTSEAALVLAGCQTLVVYEDETTGDPLESAALRAMRWQISTTTGYAEPKPDTTKRPGGKPIVIAGTTIQQVAVITRHHFSSKLQRMSCIVEGIVSKTSKKKYAVAKGSPEAIGNLLGTKPAGYDTTSEYLSKQGYRVIALAYKAFVNDDEIEKAIESRAVCESNLIFAGFIAFTCMVRKDTADVLKRLKEGGMSVAMITGDALLTALHVAKEVNIVSTDDETSSASNTAAKDPTIDPELERNEELRKLIEEKRGKPIRSSNSKEKSANNNKTSGSGKPIAYLDVGSTGSLYWKSYTDGTAIADYHASDVPTFAKQYDLLKVLLTDLLERCTTDSLCKLFAEKCANLQNRLNAKKLLNDYYDHWILLIKFTENAEAKEKKLAEELANPNAKSLFATNLLQLITNNEDSSIETIVNKFVDDSFQKEPMNQSLDILFNDFEANPADVVKLLAVDELKALLSELLYRCTTDSVCKLFAEKCENLRNVLKDKKIVYVYDDHGLLLYEFAKTAEAKEKKLIEKSTGGRRIAGLDFRMDCTIHSRFDLDRFIDRINGLFQWFGSDSSTNYERYVAPYFPMIQSSGTGKTRLLKEFKDEVNQSNDTYCELFTCESNIYESKIHKQFEIEEMEKGGVPDIDRTWRYLNSLLPKDPTKTKVVLLFDEAQKLLEKDAIYFRYIRWWLREKADETGDERIPKVVAVFTGTSTRLSSNFYPEKSMATRDSRNPSKKFWNPDGEYECYDPFIDLTTMGSVFFTDGQNYKAGSEYERAALYGRPLFAHLQIETNTMVGLNDEKRYLILQRMLFQRSNTTYRLSGSVLMNILGTRVQMGAVSFSLASELVSDGYAYLMSIRPKSSMYAIKNNKKLIEEDIAKICYQPDPVCAHLAMCLMDSQWKYDQISGCDPKFWTEAATELFSSGVCHPSSGDVGEVATALYLLFCGDIVRKQINSKYMHFSIDLATLTEQLLSNCNEGSEFIASPELSKSTNQCTVNFIQITSLHFQIPLEDLCSQEMLEWMYNSACAIYNPAFSEIFDILAPIKCIDDEGKIIFIPFLVTVKSQHDFSNSEVDEEITCMKNQAAESGIERGLSLLVLLDAKNNPLNNSTELI